MYKETTNFYDLTVLIDEYPLEPNDIGTYFNISNGRPYRFFQNNDSSQNFEY